MKNLWDMGSESAMSYVKSEDEDYDYLIRGLN